MAKSYVYVFNKKIVYKNSNLKAVVKLTKGWEYVETYESAKSAERDTGSKSQNIGRSCKLKGNALCHGFRWMYEEDYIKMINNDKTN